MDDIDSASWREVYCLQLVAKKCSGMAIFAKKPHLCSWALEAGASGHAAHFFSPRPRTWKASDWCVDALSLRQRSERWMEGDGISRLYSSVVERQSCKLKVLGSIPSGGSYFQSISKLIKLLTHMQDQRIEKLRCIPVGYFRPA